MTSYLLEGYSRVERGELPDALALIQAAARSIAREGHALRLGRAIVVPGDETWFHIVEAPSADAVELLVRRAGLRSVRITEATEFDEEHPEGARARRDRQGPRGVDSKT